METNATMGKIAIVFLSLLGCVSALKCIKCDWSLKNSTVDDSCLGAPYKQEAIECKGTSPGELLLCQTKATFTSDKSGEKNLQSLERMCGPKHADCDNTCGEGTEICWQCCKDASNCNGFPLRVNIVMTSSAADHAYILFKTIVVFFVVIYAL